MIKKVEIKNYRMLSSVEQELKPFNVLIGPNASGKSTFLDAISLVSDILNIGLESAIEKRTPNFLDLLWNKDNPKIEIALELELPEKICNIYPKKKLSLYSRSRYELIIGIDSISNELQILEEVLWLKTGKALEVKKPLGKRKKAPKGWKKIIIKYPESGNDYYFSETTRYNAPFKLGPRKSALANLTEDEERFPGAVWSKHILMEGIQVLTLNSLTMRKPCHPGKKRIFELDGSNLPVIIEDLRRKSVEDFNNWLKHLKTALSFLTDIEIKEREEDRFLYLVLKDENDRLIPSWVLSDGSLRILALTLLAYLPGNQRIYLIEEPENGIHPQAIETVYQSLSSVYQGQVFVATHSPVFLSIAKKEELLCFSRNADGSAQIISGDKHPLLRDWEGSPNLEILYASGILG